MIICKLVINNNKQNKNYKTDKKKIKSKWITK